MAESAMQDLFVAPSALTRLDIPDAEVFYAQEVPLGQPPQALLQRLINEVPWRSESIVLWGRKHLQPRLTAWYADADARYSYSGITLEPLPWSGTLVQIKGRIECFAGEYNSVLVNYYRDNRDSMGQHSDDEPELGDEPTIASVSLGHERTFVMRHKARKDLSPVRLSLKSGSLLLMRGPTQRFWTHGVPKQSVRCGPRINLTFRRILTPATRCAPDDRAH
ncbi:MAG TPA: alpha-ketoglutarate-dependent dioxygenase AlkB [Steroidobacteraceae bacterium]|nr:alpha-ketoglutarate-dependent dioxygenase AlkB [Steroidobacteraceae bacterium]